MNEPAAIKNAFERLVAFLKDLHFGGFLMVPVFLAGAIVNQIWTDHSSGWFEEEEIVSQFLGIYLYKVKESECKCIVLRFRAHPSAHLKIGGEAESTNEAKVTQQLLRVVILSLILPKL